LWSGLTTNCAVRDQPPAPGRSQTESLLAVTTADLVDIELIKQLKARYFRALDLKRPDEWALVWTEDAEFDVESGWGTDSGVRRGREQIIARSPLIRDPESISVHHGHTPEIEILSDSKATGIWAMSDYLEFPNRNGKHVRIWGYGHYLEEYVKHSGRWFIARSRLTRIRVDRVEEDLSGE
jgi:SnoaL-like protein